MNHKKTDTEPVSSQQRNKQELPSVTTRAQGCCVGRTEKHTPQLGNRYSLLSHKDVVWDVRKSILYSWGIDTRYYLSPCD
ncbi:hypothetical protein YC2023_008820 [Brassica napus]